MEAIRRASSTTTLVPGKRQSTRTSRSPARVSTCCVAGRGRPASAINRRHVALEPAVPAACDLGAGQHVEQFRGSRSDPSSASAQRRRCRRSSLISPSRSAESTALARAGPSLDPGQIDDRPWPRSSPAAASARARSMSGSVDRGVDDGTETSDVAVTQQREVERWPQREPVEAVQRSCRGPGDPARLADVEHERGAGRHGATERPAGRGRCSDRADSRMPLWTRRRSWSPLNPGGRACSREKAPS